MEKMIRCKSSSVLGSEKTTSNDIGSSKSTVNDSKENVKKGPKEGVSNAKPVSNYLKSTNSSVNKRSERVNTSSSSTDGGPLRRTGSIRVSKSHSDLRPREGPTSNSKVCSAKKVTSTPRNTPNRQLNFSGGSAIKPSAEKKTNIPVNGSSECALSKPRIGGLPLTVRRNLGDYDSAGSGIAIRGPMRVFAPGHDQESRNKELEMNIARSAYTRAMYLRVAAEREVRCIEKDGLVQINHLWTCNKQLVERHTKIERQNLEMKKMIESLRILRIYEDYLETYDEILHSLASPIDEISKDMLQNSARFKVVGIPEKQREQLLALLKNSPMLSKQNQEKNEKINSVAHGMSQLSAHLKETVTLTKDCERLVCDIESSNKKLERFAEVQRSLGRE